MRYGWTAGAQEDGETAHQSQNTRQVGYLDGLLAALDFLNLGLGQGDPLPNGLQLAPAQLHSLGDPVVEKMQRLGAAPTPCSLCTSCSKSRPAIHQGPGQRLSAQCQF